MKTRGCLDKDTTKLVLVESFLSQESYLSLDNRYRPVIIIAILFEGEA